MIEADEACDRAATELEKGREARSNKMSEKQREAFVRRRAERADAWAEQLPIQVRRNQAHKNELNCATSSSHKILLYKPNRTYGVQYT